MALRLERARRGVGLLLGVKSECVSVRSQVIRQVLQKVHLNGINVVKGYDKV